MKMLETEEVDIDYFTPATGTSLAKIFSNNPQVDESDKTSLKYVPPLPAQTATKFEDTKSSQCIYASALFAYEWIKDSYISKERVGFAIMKMLKTEIYNIILYDSNKTTLSCLTLSPKTEIITKENVSISYYDNQRKYWNVYTNPQEYKKIYEILQSLKVCLKASVDAEKDFVDNKDSKNDEIQSLSVINNNPSKEDKESDTDSSINRKTKDSILKRMAHMGQSVLPPNNLMSAQTSDSSDTNEPHNQHKPRHKPGRNISKKYMGKNIPEFEKHTEPHIDRIIAKPLNMAGTTYKHNDQQIVPIQTIEICKSPVKISEATDVNILISEQRVSNSELRLNMNRLTDKLDVLLDKVKDIQDNTSKKISPSTSSSQFQNDIVYKLLNEYEKKIKYYEDFIKSNGLDCDSSNQIKYISCKSIDQDEKVQEGSTSKTELIHEKDKKIYELKEEIKILSNKLNEQIKVNSSNNNLVEEIEQLKDNLIAKDNEVVNLNQQLENFKTIKNDISTKIKQIMNDTFQTISANFDNDENYTGARIKSTVASIIKKTTIDCLKDT